MKNKAIFVIEGEIPENMHYELSKKINEVAKSFGLDSYLDDVDEEDNICEHNNTITNECSDCNEQELIDAHHQRVLRVSLIEIYNICCDSLDDIVSHHCEGYKEFIYIVEENVKNEIYNRLNYEYKCIKGEGNE